MTCGGLCPPLLETILHYTDGVNISGMLKLLPPNTVSSYSSRDEKTDAEKAKSGHLLLLAMG